MRRSGMSLVMVITILVIAGLTITALFTLTLGDLSRSRATFTATLEDRREELIADSFLQWAIHKGRDYMGTLTDCTGWRTYEDFLDHLSEYENGVWYELARNASRCAKIDHEVLRSAIGDEFIGLDSLKDLKVFYLKGATYSFLVSYADINRGHFSWAFGTLPESTSSTLTSSEYPYNYAAFSGGTFSTSRGFARSAEVDGPVLSSENVYLGASRDVVFHDEVIASGVTRYGWGRSLTFEKDVVVNDFTINRGGNIDVRGRLYADSVYLGGMWSGGRSVNFEKGICATSVRLGNANGISVSDILRAEDLEISSVWGRGVDLDAVICANDMTVQNTNSLEFGNDVYATNLTMAGLSGGNAIFNGDNLMVYNTMEIKTTSARVDFNSRTRIGKMSVENHSNNLNFNTSVCFGNLSVYYMKNLNFFNDAFIENEGKLERIYGMFNCRAHLCATDLELHKLENVELNELTVFDELDIERITDYRVGGESSIVGDYIISRMNRFRITGDTYVKDELGGDCSPWQGGFYGDLYVTRDPDLDLLACIHGDLINVDPTIFRDVECSCPIPWKSCPDEVSSCLETAQASFDLIDHPNDVFENLDVDEYLDGVKSQTRDVVRLCDGGSPSPIGVRFGGDSSFYMNYDSLTDVMTIIELNKNVAIEFKVGDGCPPYNATITCTSGSSNFKFNGIVYVDGNASIGTSSSWLRGFLNWILSVLRKLGLDLPPLSTRAVRVYELAGKVSFVVNGNMDIYKHMKYTFLSDNTRFWERDVESTSRNDVYSFIAKGNVVIKPFSWSSRTLGLSAVVISLDGRIDVPYWQSGLTILGSLIAKDDVNLGRSQNPRLILDPRLTKGSPCGSIPGAVVADPFGDFIGGGGGGNAFEVWARR